jgi:hypothetical protein
VYSLGISLVEINAHARSHAAVCEVPATLIGCAGWPAARSLVEIYPLHWQINGIINTVGVFTQAGITPDGTCIEGKSEFINMFG